MESALDRYAVVGIQTAFGSASDRDALDRNLDRVVELIEGAVWAYAHWGAPVRLICLPEFCLQGIRTTPATSSSRCRLPRPSC